MSHGKNEWRERVIERERKRKRVSERRERVEVY